MRISGSRQLITFVRPRVKRRLERSRLHYRNRVTLGSFYGLIRPPCFYCSRFKRRRRLWRWRCVGNHAPEFKSKAPRRRGRHAWASSISRETRDVLNSRRLVKPRWYSLQTGSLKRSFVANSTKKRKVNLRGEPDSRHALVFIRNKRGIAGGLQKVTVLAGRPI